MKLAACLLAAAIGAWGADSAKTAFQSGPGRVALIELYSSEGCSSCPPADQWLSTLASAKGLWTDFVPVAFQVDYWNRLGWPDPLSSPEFTRRQRAYAQSWGNDGVYTPGLVRNGREWRDWGGPPPEKSNAAAGALEASVEGRFNVRIGYRPEGGAKGPWTAHAALLAMGIESDVRAGENSGRKLRHDFAAVDYTHGPLDGAGRTDFHLRPKLALNPKRYALAVWVTAAASPAPVQAAGGYLP